MSSLRILEKLGAAKPSRNVPFEIAHENFEKTNSSVLALDAALRGFLISLKAFHIAAHVLGGAIEAIGGTPDSSNEMKQLVGEVKEMFEAVDVKFLNASVNQFEASVLKPCSGWLGSGAHIKQQINNYEEEKLIFDHYTRKVQHLREARGKRVTSGKTEKPKDVEKLVRNEQKLSAATNSYSKIAGSTITNMREFVNMREEALTPLIHRVLSFRVEYANALAEESRQMDKHVQQDTVANGVLGKLEGLMAKFTGNGNSAAASDSTNGGSLQQASCGAIDEEAHPVQTLSFASFVGETPPFTAQHAQNQPALEGIAECPDSPPPPPPQPTKSDDFGAAFMDSTSPSGSAPVQPFQSFVPVAPSAPENPWDSCSCSTSKPPPPPPIAVFVPPPPPPAATPWDTFDDTPLQQRSVSQPFQFTTVGATPLQQRSMSQPFDFTSSYQSLQ